MNSSTLAQVQVATINPVIDASIFEQNPNQGAGYGPLHSGHSCSGYSTRALMRFLFYSIPAGSTIVSANLTLNVISVDPAGTDTGNYILHPLTFGFSETQGGSATPANWIEAGGGFTIYYWTTPGGDYSLDTLSSQFIPPVLGLQNFPTSNTFVSYVQSWLDDPSTNHGMILIADTSTCNTLRSFDSWELPVPPVLEVTYILPCSTGPGAVCQDIDVYLDGSGNGSIVASDLDAGSVDSCMTGGLTFSASQTSFSCADLSTGGGLVISGVYDGPLPGGHPKGVELFAGSAIADLSAYGIGSANNGGGTNGQEFTFPAVAVPAGTFIYITSDSTGFNNFFGFNADYESNAMLINGDDAVELFQGGVVIDVFGDINVDGTGQPWEFLDGWAYRNDLQGANAGIFNDANWTFSGINVFDGQTSNTTSPTPFPLASYTAPGAGVPVTLTVTDGLGNTDMCTAFVTVLDTLAPVADVATLADLDDDCEVAMPTAPTATDNCTGAVTGTTTTTFPVTASTTITWTYTDASGNTSTQDQIVTITGLDVTTTSTGGATITANATGVTYQWINCFDNSVVSGETGQTFTTFVNGDYAVIVTDGACSDTSACVNIAVEGIDELIDLGMTISPNPSTGIFTVAFDKIVSGNVTIVDANGRLVQTLELNSNSLLVDLSVYQSGLYIMQVSTENGVSRERVVKY